MPLSQRTQNYGTRGESDNDEDDDGSGSESSEIFNLDDTSSLLEKIETIISCSFPTISTLLMTVFSMTITMYFAGILSERTQNQNIFAGISLASTFANLSFSSIMEGFASALESLSSQHNGSKNYLEVGLTLHQSIVSLSILSIPILISWYYVGDLFISLGVDPDICLVTQNFLTIRLIATPGEILILTYEKYLQSMGLMSPSMHAAGIYNIFLIILCFFFIHVFKYSYQCLAYAHILCTYLQLFSLILLSIKTKEVQRTLVSPSERSFHNIYFFLRYGASGCVMICAEWWAYEILTIFASFISSAAISAQSILLQLIVILFMFPLGVSISVASIVGNSIGSESFQLAKSIGNLSFALVFVLDLLLSPLVYFYGISYTHIFTSDPLIIALCQRCLPLLCFQIFIDGFQAVGSGILRGAGRQSLGAIVNLIAFYLIALPLGWYLCFNQDLGIFGLFLGVCIGSISQTIAILCGVYYYSEYIYQEIDFVKKTHVKHQEERYYQYHQSQHEEGGDDEEDVNFPMKMKTSNQKR
jgi:multidrug resistance protein, MATE family